jgi:hypothetical protein
MHLIIKPTEFKPSIICPTGSYFARIYQVIDLGTHNENKFQSDETVARRKIKLSFELPTKTHIFDEKKSAQPFSMHLDVTLSITNESSPQQSTLSKIIKACGMEITDLGFNVFDLLGAGCVVTIKHSKPDKNGVVWSNLDTNGFTPISEEMLEAMITKPEKYDVVNEQKALYLEENEFKSTVFESLPEKTKEKIRESKEWGWVASGFDPKFNPYV